MYQQPIRPDELYHHGVLGMHWGIRRYQNYDGTWKNAKGRKRHSKQEAKSENGGSIREKVSNTAEKLKKNYITEQAKDYRKTNKGMTVAESREAAEKKLQMMRNIAIGAAVIGGKTLAVASARYIGRNYVERVIKAGTTIQTLSHDPDRLAKGEAFSRTL